MTMLVPFRSSEATDTLTRFLSEQMRGALGQPIVIDNVAGSVGVGRVVRSPMEDLLAEQIIRASNLKAE
jgi:tripartite-type tricarboxylate transporter receptor subunit TctC